MSAANATQNYTTGFIPAPGDKGRPITVIGTSSIRAQSDRSRAQS